MQLKREFWDAQIGKMVTAHNYRGTTATGRLLAVSGGLWGYGGDAVALMLNVNDDRGLPYWPAGLCQVVSASETLKPTQEKTL